MKLINVFLFLFISFFLFISLASNANAVSNSYNTTINSSEYSFPPEALDSWGADSAGIVSGSFAIELSPIGIQLNYSAKVINLDTGQEIDTASTGFAVGTKFLVQVKQVANSDFTWFATGGGTDSPFGAIINGAANPCPDPASFWTTGCGNYFQTLPECGSECLQHVWMEISINPPTYSVTHKTGAGYANVSCDTSGINCTVISAGIVDSQINFNPTYGKVYLAQIGEYQNTVNPTSLVLPPLIYNFTTGAISGQGDYVFNIPSIALEHNFVAVRSDNPPTIPIITGPSDSSAVACNSFDFSFTSTDPNYDTIQYWIDWDNDGVADESTSFVTSGTTKIVSHIFTTTGTKTIKAYARNNTGLTSKNPDGSLGWGTLTFNVPFACLSASVAGPYSVVKDTDFSVVGSAVGGVGPLSYSWGFVDNLGGCLVKSGGDTLTPVVSCSDPFSAKIRLVVSDSHVPQNSASAVADITVLSVPPINLVPPVFSDFNYCFSDVGSKLSLTNFVVDANRDALVFSLINNSGGVFCRLDGNLLSAGPMAVFGQWCDVQVVNQFGLSDVARVGVQVGYCVPGPLMAFVGGPYVVSAGSLFVVSGNAFGGVPFFDSSSLPYYDVNWSFVGVPSNLSVLVSSGANSLSPGLGVASSSFFDTNLEFNVLLGVRDSNGSSTSAMGLVRVLPYTASPVVVVNPVIPVSNLNSVVSLNLSKINGVFFVTAGCNKDLLMDLGLFSGNNEALVSVPSVVSCGVVPVTTQINISTPIEKFALLKAVGNISSQGACDVCVKDAFLPITPPASNQSIPDNDLILVLMVCVIGVLIVFGKQKLAK